MSKPRRNRRVSPDAAKASAVPREPLLPVGRHEASHAGTQSHDVEAPVKDDRGSFIWDMLNALAGSGVIVVGSSTLKLL